MRIGFDFDNTIVNYDALFYKVACEYGVTHENLAVNKLAVRDYLRQINKEDIWTEMQGYVYGARMNEAIMYPCALDVMQTIKKAGHVLAIVSHKTKYPYLGKPYDLHASARQWIAEHLQEKNTAGNAISLIAQQHIFFEVTKEDKLARIANFDCDVFIDDLPEILLAADFPAKTIRYLFDPENKYSENDLPGIKVVSSWEMLKSYLL